MDKREEIKPDAWVIRSPETGKVLWHEAEASRSAFSPDWIEDGWEVVPVYLGSALSQARSQDYEECAKIAEDDDGEHTIFGEDRNTRVSQMTARAIAAAIRSKANQ